MGWDYVSTKPSSIITTPQIKDPILDSEKPTTLKLNVLVYIIWLQNIFLFVTYPNIAQEDC